MAKSNDGRLLALIADALGFLELSDLQQGLLAAPDRAVPVTKGAA
jgi:hypothetical protein